MSIKLVHSVISGKKSIFEIINEVDTLIKSSIANGDFSALKYITNEFSGIYDYDGKSPYWLLSDFTAPIWKIQSNTKKTIDWDSVILDDGEKLTSEKHLLLLNAFKHWILAVDDPFSNGGKLINPSTVQDRIDQIIGWINAILLNSKSIDLPKQHLSGLTNEFLMAVLVNIGKGKRENGIYHFHTRTKTLLLDKIKSISNADVSSLVEKYPTITRNISPEDCPLDLSVIERVKACYWLEQQGFYLNEKNNIKLKGNGAVLKKLIYQSKIICCDSIQFNSLEELSINPSSNNCEYLPVKEINDSSNSCKGLIKCAISNLKYLSFINEKDNCSHCPYDAIKNITLKRVLKHVQLKPLGRTQTLPFEMVFNIFCDCFTFVDAHQKAILDTMQRVLIESSKIARRKIVFGKKIDSEKLSIWRTSDEALSLIDKSLLELGVKLLNIKSNREDKFIALRANEGFLELFQVLTGSIQVLVGIIMGRRQDELTSLSATHNLLPNIDPASDEGKIKDYNLIFNLKKSGSAGKNAVNDRIKRPIPRSIALLIWNLEQFNQTLIDCNLKKNDELSLFNNVANHNFNLTKTNACHFNNALNSVSDYFETPVIKDDKGLLKRYYVRQHPLRRFLAMVFFWSSGYEGLETIRWMLGHSDIEHLYYYVTESQPGGVLKGVKASFMIDALEGKVKLEGIDALRKLIAKRYDVKGRQIEIISLSTAIDEYDDEDFSTVPTIDELRQRKELEGKILDLLKDDIISLEPEFFMTGDHECFNLVLKITENDGE